MFTKPRIFVAVALIYSCALNISLAVDLMTILAYQAVGRAMKITHILHAAVYFIPSAVISSVTSCHFKAQIQPTQSMEVNEDQTCAVTGIIVKPVRKALKMFVLVSESFWMTGFWGHLGRHRPQSIPTLLSAIQGQLPVGHGSVKCPQSRFNRPY